SPRRCTLFPYTTLFRSMPGVPYEMKGILNNYLVPKIISEFNRPHIIHKTIMTYGMGESLIAERIEQWEDALPSYIRLAYLPSPRSEEHTSELQSRENLV